MSLPLDAGTLVAWLNAVRASGVPAVVSALHGVVDGVIVGAQVLPLEMFLTRVPPTAAYLLLPVPGDTAGLPPEAASAPAAVFLLSGDQAWIVTPPGAGERWWSATMTQSVVTPPPDPREARRMLARVMRETAEVLESLGLQREDERLSQRLAQVDRDLSRHPLPRGMDGRAAALIEQATRMLAVVELALETEGASVTSRESHGRADVLREVSRAARGALAAAYSWPGTVIG